MTAEVFTKVMINILFFVLKVVKMQRAWEL